MPLKYSHAAKLTKTPQETEMVEHMRIRAQEYAASQARNEEQAAGARSAERPAEEPAEKRVSDSDMPHLVRRREFVPSGPHRFVVGVLRAVRCDASNMELTVTSGAKTLSLYSDSELLVKQLNGQYKVKAPHLIPMYLKVLQLKRAIPKLRVEHVRREQNNEADGLANRAIDERAPVPAWLELEARGR